MGSKRAIKLDSIGNYIEHILPYPEICLKNCYEFLAVIWIYPHTVL